MSQWFQLSSVLFWVADTFIWLNFRFAGGPLPASDEHVAKIQKPLQGFILHPISASIIHLLLFTQVKLKLVLSHFNFTVKFNFCLILLSLSWMVKILHLISLSITYHLITLQVTSRPRLNLFSYHFQSLITFNITCPGDKLFIPLSITFHFQFQVTSRPGLNKAQLADSLSRHFHSLPVVEKEAITYFLYMIKVQLFTTIHIVVTVNLQHCHHLLPLHDQGAIDKDLNYLIFELYQILDYINIRLYEILNYIKY